MPAVSPQRLVAALCVAFEESRHSAVLLSGVRSHPGKFAVLAPDGEQTLVWVYAWTLTHGGRPSLPHEYRIQMTSVSAPLALNPAGPTVLVGYEPNLKMLAGFDLRGHREFTEGSPSVQIDIRTVRQALQDGLAFDRKNNAEIAIGIRPDQFVTYVHNAVPLHQYGVQARVLGLLNRATALEDIAEADLARLAEPRRRLIHTVSRLSRSANFRQKVLQAYGYRCAVTGLETRTLVEATRIVSLGGRRWTNDVCNGIALLPTYCRAFDKGLIFLDESYHMRVAPAAEARVLVSHLRAYPGQTCDDLGRVLLPPDRLQWPSIRLIRRASRLRRFALRRPA